MAQSKGGNGTVAADDLLSGIEEDEPLARRTSEGTREAFTPVPALIAHFQAAFAEGKAVRIKRTFATESDAKKAAHIYHLHGLEVAEAMDPPKSAAIRTQPVDKDGNALDLDPKYNPNAEADKARVTGYTVRVQLTHQRKAKGENGNGETQPETTPAQ